MKKVNVYLHDVVYDTLTLFGDINSVVNRILDAFSEGKIDITNKPKCPEKMHGSQYCITIENQDYINLLNTLGRSSSISLRRLLYWFVDQEVYNELEWEVTRNVKDKQQLKTKVIKYINNSIDSLCSAKVLVKKQTEEKLQKIIDDLFDIMKEGL